MDFPTKLSRLCWQRGWSQRQLADALGRVSKSTVSNWFHGRTEPALGDLARLARLFAVSVDYLALDEREEPGGDALSEPQRRLLWAAAETVGYDVALRRIMVAPDGDPVPQAGKRPRAPDEETAGLEAGALVQAMKRLERAGHQAASEGHARRGAASHVTAVSSPTR